MTDQSNNQSHPYPCSYSVELAKRVDKMEIAVDKVEGLVASIDKRSSITDAVLSRIEITFNKTIDVLDRVEDTMLKMQSGMSEQSHAINNLENEFIKMRGKMDESESKFKVDIRDVLKKTIDKNSHLLIPGGIVTSSLIAIIAFAKWMVENPDKVSAFLQIFK